jgi:hypothetical protein
MVSWDEERRAPAHAPVDTPEHSLTPSRSLEFAALGDLGAAVMSLPLVENAHGLAGAFSGVVVRVGEHRMSVINTDATRATDIGRALLLLTMARDPGDGAAALFRARRAAHGAVDDTRSTVMIAEVHGRRVASWAMDNGELLTLSAFETMVRTSQAIGASTVARLADIAHRSFLLDDRTPVFKLNTLFRAMNQHLKTGTPNSRLFHRVPGTREVDTWVRVGDRATADARHRLARCILLDLPFNPSGRGWGKPGEQRALMHAAGVSFEATAQHSWTATLGVRSTDPGGYDALWPTMFSIAARDDRFCVVALRDLNPGLPIGVPLGVLRYQRDFAQKVHRLGALRGAALPVSRFLWLDSTDDDGLPLGSTVDADGVRTTNPMAFIPTSATVGKASNVVVSRVSTDVFLFMIGPRGVRRGRELCVRI